MFPSLINCCTVDWFTEWPRDALEKVATKFLEDLDLDDEARGNCVQVQLELDLVVCTRMKIFSISHTYRCVCIFTRVWVICQRGCSANSVVEL